MHAKCKGHPQTKCLVQQLMIFWVSMSSPTRVCAKGIAHGVKLANTSYISFCLTWELAPCPYHLNLEQNPCGLLNTWKRRWTSTLNKSQNLLTRRFLLLYREILLIRKILHYEVVQFHIAKHTIHNSVSKWFEIAWKTEAQVMNEEWQLVLFLKVLQHHALCIIKHMWQDKIKNKKRRDGNLSSSHDEDTVKSIWSPLDRQANNINAIKGQN